MLIWRNKYLTVLALSIGGCGSGTTPSTGAPGPAAPAAITLSKQGQNIPADSFRFSVEKSGTSETKVERTMLIELPSSLTSPRTILIGLGENPDTHTGPGLKTQDQGLASVSVEIEDEAGADEMKIRVLFKITGVQREGPVRIDGAITGGPFLFRLAKGKELTDALVFEAETGVYKMENPLRLGRIITKDRELIMHLHVAQPK